MITGAESIIRSLEAAGVEVIFGYPGATIAPFYDKLEKSNIRHILVRHEQHAGHAASGYARITEKPAVCVTTSGPGATNLITALATAYMDSIPIVAITGQVSTDLLGRDVFQEADITGATESFTKYSFLVKDADDIPRIFAEAFHIAGSGRPGPVLIDIPVDVQTQRTNYSVPKEVAIRGYKPTVKGHIGQVKRFVKAINTSEKPLFCVGGGVFLAKAKDELVKMSEALNIPVVSTMMGTGVMPTEHPNYMGMVGMHGKSGANEALHDTDLLIILGARVSDRAVLTPSKVAKSKKVVHIDIDPAEIGKNLSTTIPIVGDIKEIILQTMGAEPTIKSKEWISHLYEKKKKTKPDYGKRENAINPKSFINKLTKRLPESFIYVADVGQNQLWSAAHANIRSDRFLTSGGMGTMGYSISCAIGAKLASPDKTVIAVCGDGSFQMGMMEIATACQHKVDVKIIVMSNGQLGLVRDIQSKSFQSNYFGVDLSGSPQIIKIAEAYGINSARVTCEDEVDEGIEKFVNSKGLFLLECVVSENESTI